MQTVKPESHPSPQENATFAFVNLHHLLPSISWLSNYRKENWKGDWPAGLTVGIMLIPQGMAYAMIAGLPVVYGLYAALVPQVVYGFLGTSRHLAVGPVAMDSLLVAAGLTGIAVAGSEDYIALALLLALIMGVLQLVMGTLRLGFLVNFLSKPVISGFTSAAALIIGLNQLPHLLGVSSSQSNQLHHLMEGIRDSLGDTHLATLTVGVLSIGALGAMKRWAPKLPGALVVVVVSIFTSWIVGFDSLGIRVVGHIPSGLPSWSLPNPRWEELQELFPIAMTLALVAFMEAISVAKAIEEHHDYRVDANQELRALGMANILGSMFQSYPTTGGFSRTAVTEQAGGQTPATAWIAASVVGLTLFALTPLFYHLPNAVLAAIVMVAVAGLVDWKLPRHLLKHDKVEAGFLAFTFLTTAFVSLPIGIGLGVLLAVAWSVRQMMQPHVAELGELEGVFRNVKRFPNAQVDADVLIVRYDGPINFANQSNFREFMTRMVKKKGQDLRLIVLQADTVAYVDASAKAMLKNLIEEWQPHSIELCMAGTIGPVRDALMGDEGLVGLPLRFQLNVHDALAEWRQPGSVPPVHQDMAQQHG